MLVLISGLALLDAREAEAKRRIVIMEPSVAYKCPQQKTWAAVETCLQQFGKPGVIKSIGATVKLVALAATAEVPRAQTGLYLYVQKGPLWRLAGMYEGEGVDLLKLEAIVINKHAGFRLDLGQTLHSSVAVDADGTSVRPALVRIGITLYCGGDNYGCSQVTTLCDAIVGGKTISLFRGEQSIVENAQVTVAGDHRFGGSMCQAGDRIFLGWSPNLP